MDMYLQDFFEDEDLEILDFIEHGLPRQIYERNNYFDTLDDIAFRRRFRLSRNTVLNLLAQIEHRLEFPYDSNNCVSPMNQLLVCLRLFSTGGHLQTMADFAGIHLSTVSRIVRRVSEAIAELYNQYIIFPNDENSIRKTQQDFYDIASFPRVSGAVDCTHIKILSPGGEDPEIYRNRKSYFSINTQMVCDAKLKILNVVARWPGSAHDSTIFNNSVICRNFEQRIYRNCVLLGDSGYALRPYLFTPLLNPRLREEQLYNEAHIRTRNVIERCFGVLKRRFPILAYGCRLHVNTTLTIIVATAVLDNLCLLDGDINPPLLPDELDEHILNELIINGQIPEVLVHENENINVDLRRQFITQYFANL